jgi:hypothetical protein
MGKANGHDVYSMRFQAFPAVWLLCGVNWLKFPDVSGRLVGPIMGRTIRVSFLLDASLRGVCRFFKYTATWIMWLIVENEKVTYYLRSIVGNHLTNLSCVLCFIYCCCCFVIVIGVVLCCGLLWIDAFAKLRIATISFDISEYAFAWNNSASTGRIFMKFDIRVFFENLSRKFKFH